MKAGHGLMHIDMATDTQFSKSPCPENNSGEEAQLYACPNGVRGNGYSRLPPPYPQVPEHNVQIVPSEQTSHPSHEGEADHDDDHMELGEEGGSVMMSVTVCRVGEKNQELRVPLEISVLDFKRDFFAADFKRKANIRVIFLGKILDNSSNLLANGVTNGAHLHVMISNLHGSHDGEIEQTRGDGGYDTDDQIIHDLEVAQRLAEDDSDGEGVDVRRVNFIRPTRNGTRAEFTLGFALGMLLGIIMLIWVFSRSASRRFKMGILSGIAMNIITGWGLNGIFHEDAEGDEQPQNGEGYDWLTGQPTTSTPGMET